MLDHGEDPRRDEPCGADHATGAGELTNLHGRARAADLHCAPGASGFNHILAR